MMTLFGVRNILIASPLLALVAAWSLPASLDVTPSSAPALEPVATQPVVDGIEEPGVDASAFLINNCTYYNNANRTQVVGQFGYDCCNNPVAWGRKTRYYDCGGCFPCFPPPQ